MLALTAVAEALERHPLLQEPLPTTLVAVVVVPIQAAAAVARLVLEGLAVAGLALLVMQALQQALPI